jgi:hypothetical protein
MDVDRVRKTLMLSANHVFANSLSVKNPASASAGDEILQQGPSDGGKLPAVGHLEKWVQLQTRGNHVDAALASCDPTVGWESAVPHIGEISGTSNPVHGTEVRKVGRSTGPTTGTISAYPLRSLPVQFGAEVFRFDEAIEITGNSGPFSRQGDSGAVVLDHSRMAVGLLFAGTGHVTYANPMTRVKAALGFARFKGE